MVESPGRRSTREPTSSLSGRVMHSRNLQVVRNPGRKWLPPRVDVEADVDLLVVIVDLPVDVVDLPVDVVDLPVADVADVDVVDLPRARARKESKYSKLIYY